MKDKDLMKVHDMLQTSIEDLTVCLFHQQKKDADPSYKFDKKKVGGVAIKNLKRILKQLGEKP